MAAQIEVELCRMCDSHVDGRSRRYVSAFPALLFLVSAEEPRVMSLLHHYEGDTRLVVALQFDASLADRRQLVLQQLQELTFGDAVTIEDDAMGFVAAGRFVKHYQELPDHRAQFLYDLLPMLLDSHGGGVTRRMGVHRTDDGGDRRFLVVTGGRVRHVGPQEYDGFVKYLWSDRWHKDAVDTP